MKFDELCLEKLIATCYIGSPIANTQLSLFDDEIEENKTTKMPHKIEITEIPDMNQDGAVDLTDVELLLGSNKNYLTRLNADGDFRSKECIELLKQADNGRFGAMQMFEFAKKVVNNPIMFNHALKHIITNCVVLENIELAEELIPNFKGEDNWDIGYLILLKHFAMQGDDTNFFTYFKQSKPAINKFEVNEAKGFLVINFAKKNGIEKTIVLCKHKNIGVKHYFSALTGGLARATQQWWKVRKIKLR